MSGTLAAVIPVLAVFVGIFITLRKLPGDSAGQSVEQAAKLMAAHTALTDNLQEELSREQEKRRALETVVAQQTEKIMELGRSIKRLTRQVRSLGAEPDMGVPDD